MKPYTRHKTCEEIRQQCEAQGVPFNIYLNGTIVVGLPHSGWAIYDMMSGWFSGTTPDGVDFNPLNQQQHDHEPWMQALLQFFYVYE